MWLWTSRRSNVGCDHHARRLDDDAEPAHFVTSEKRFKRVFLEGIDRLDQTLRCRYSENVSCDDHVLTTGDRALLTDDRNAVSKTATYIHSTGWEQVHLQVQMLQEIRQKPGAHGWRIVETRGGAFPLVAVHFKAK